MTSIENDERHPSDWLRRYVVAQTCNEVDALSDAHWNAGSLEGEVQGKRRVAGSRMQLDAKAVEARAQPRIPLNVRAGFWRWILFASLFSLAACGAQAQSAIIESYQESAGLTNLTALCLTQDVRGTLWICTENGLFRFDGFRIYRETLPAEAGSVIFNALADRKGQLWVETETGLYLRREEEGKAHWRSVAVPGGKPLFIERGQRLTLDERGTLFAMDQDNRLWTVSTGAAASEVLIAQPVATPAFAPFEQTNDTNSGPLLAIGRTLWFGCGSGLCQWQDGRIRTWGPAQGLPPAPWSALLLGRDGSLWARSSRRLAHLAPRDERFATLDAPASLKFAGTIAMAEDSSGAIVTAADDDVARWDGRHWQHWAPAEGMPGTAVRTLLFDREGSLWLGTNGRGLHQWVGYGAVDHWTPVSGLPHSATTAFARTGDGRLWAATPDGIAWFDEASRKFRPLGKPPTSGGLVLSLGVDSTGALWWVQAGRLLTLRSVDSQPRVVLDDARQACVVQGPHGLYLTSPQHTQQLLPSSSNALSELRPTDLPEGGLLARVITDGTHDWFLTGQDWFLTGHHMVRAERDSWVPMRDERNEPLALSSSAQFIGPSELWAPDQRGIGVYAVRDDVAHLVRRIDAASFGGAAIKYIRADTSHRIWVGTDQGLFVLDAGHWSHIDRTNGLLWNDIETQAILFDGDGTAWIGTSAGATQIHPGLKRATAPALRLDELQFGTHTAYAAPRAPIAWAGRRMRLTVGTPSISRGRSTRLEFRLHGNEPWQAVDGNVIQLELPDPDSYQLEVRAAARLSIDEPGPALQIAFELAPPWWASTPARLGYAASLGGLWFFSTLVMRRRSTAIQRRLEQAVDGRTRALADRTLELENSREALHKLGEYNVRSLEAERKRVSRELHDEMGQQLAAMRMEVSVARMRMNACQSLDDGTLDMLLERVDGLVASVRTLVTRLRPPALDGGLLPAIEWLATEFSRGAGVPCDLDLDVRARELPPDTATMVFRIAQESLTNVFRHAGAREVSLTLRPTAGQWELVVSDDGVGFDAARVQSGHGLLGMSERARVVGGTLSINSAQGGGTTIRLVVGQTGVVVQEGTI